MNETSLANEFDWLRRVVLSGGLKTPKEWEFLSAGLIRASRNIDAAIADEMP